MCLNSAVFARASSKFRGIIKTKFFLNVLCKLACVLYGSSLRYFECHLLCLLGVTVPQVGPPSKRVHRDPVVAPPQTPAVIAEPAVPSPVNLLNGNRNRMGLVARTGRKHVVSWMDAPDDLYFKSTVATKLVIRYLNSFIFQTRHLFMSHISLRNTRKLLSIAQLRRAARKPWRNLLLQNI